MPCTPLPPDFFPTPPSLPGGIGIPAYTQPSADVGLCCNYQVPPWGLFPLPLPPLPPGFLAPVVAFLATVQDGLALVFDALAIPCPTQ